MRAKPYATIASGSSSVKSWASTRWPNRFGKSSWMSRIIKLIWPRLSAKKCRMSAVRGGRHQRSKLANTAENQHQPDGCGSSKLNAARFFAENLAFYEWKGAPRGRSSITRSSWKGVEELDSTGQKWISPPLEGCSGLVHGCRWLRPRLCSGDADHRVAAER